MQIQNAEQHILGSVVRNTCEGKRRSEAHTIEFRDPDSQVLNNAMAIAIDSIAETYDNLKFVPRVGTM